jgi:hypothetical protein
MKRFLLLSAAVGALLVAPNALASTQHSSTGTVIALTRGGVLVAGGRGLVGFAPGHARVGDRVVMRGSSLRIVGFARAARLSGVVAARRGNVLVLSAAHRLFPVRMRGRAPAAVSDRSGPQPGEVVGATVSIDEHGDVVATSTDDEGHVGAAHVQATITAIGTNTITLSVNGESIVLPLPAGTTLSPALVGTQVTLTLTFANGTTVANEDEQGENEDQNGDDDQNDNGSQATSGHDQGDDGGNDGSGGGDG